jgi:hypothetical protein
MVAATPIGNGVYELSNGARGRFVSESKDGIPFRYADTPRNQELGRVGKPYQRFVLFQGADEDKIPRGVPRRPITIAQAKRAFNAYWNRKLREAGNNRNKLRAVAAARSRDLSHGVEKNIRLTTSYRRNPGRFEYPGVDVGTKQFRSGSQLSQKQRDALARGRATLQTRRAVKKQTQTQTQSRTQTQTQRQTKSQTENQSRRRSYPQSPLMTMQSTIARPETLSSRGTQISPVFDSRATAFDTTEEEVFESEEIGPSRLADLRSDQNTVNDLCIILQNQRNISIPELRGMANEVIRVVSKYGVPSSRLIMGNDQKAVRNNCRVLREHLAGLAAESF